MHEYCEVNKATEAVKIKILNIIISVLPNINLMNITNFSFHHCSSQSEKEKLKTWLKLLQKHEKKSLQTFSSPLSAILSLQQTVFSLMKNIKAAEPHFCLFAVYALIEFSIEKRFSEPQPLLNGKHVNSWKID